MHCLPQVLADDGVPLADAGNGAADGLPDGDAGPFPVVRERSGAAAKSGRAGQLHEQPLALSAGLRNLASVAAGLSGSISASISFSRLRYVTIAVRSRTG